MIFDFRVYLGRSFDGREQTVEDLLRSMDRLNIDRALACPYKPLSYDLQAANRELAQAVGRYPDRLLGAARIDPWQPDAAADAERLLDSFSGMKALYSDPWEENFRADLDRLDPVMALAEARRLPVLVASGRPWVSEALQVCHLAQRWPKVTVIMTNGGQINISGLGQADVTLALGKASNLLIDTAGVYRQDFLEETVETFGAQRVLFASGAPDFDQRYELLRIDFMKVSPEEKLLLQAGNALRLLDAVRNGS